MDIHIDQIRAAQPEEWDVIWRQCSYATYFHSREWAEIWIHYSQEWMRPNPLLVMFSDGKEALLPLSCELSYGSVKSFWSSPEGTYGGWIAMDPLGREHAILMKEFLTRELGRLYWQTNPYDDLVAAAGLDANIENETHAIDLERGFDAVYRDWSSACRRAERKARRCGVVVREANKKEDWRCYYQAYEDSQRRWGERTLSHHRWSLFQAMYDLQSEYLRLWLATNHEGRIIAGALMGYAKTHAAYWHGAALETYLVLRPMNLLFYELIRDACEKGYKWFDFNPSGGLDGVRRFKESFGAKPLHCPILHVKPEGI